MTATEILKDITKQIATCIGLPACNNWAAQRADGAVFDGNTPNGGFLGIDNATAPNGYIRLNSELDFTTLSIGSCRNLQLITAEFAAVLWANASSPTGLMDNAIFRLMQCKPKGSIYNYPKITIERANYDFDSIFEEETAKPAVVPNGLTLAKVTFTVEVSVSACDITAPACYTARITPPIVFDDDALTLFADIENTGATLDEPTRIATNNLYIQLKSASLYDKLQAFYPIIGGTAAAHKFNGKNPADTNAAFRLLFLGGWIHSSTGAKPDGITGYANTFYQVDTNGALGDLHIAYYSRTNNSGAHIEMGAVGNTSSSGSGQLYIAPNVLGSNFRAVNTTGNYSSASNLNTAAFFVSSRTSLSSIEFYRNAAQIISNSGLPNSISNRTIYVGARNNNGVTDAYSTREAAFLSIGAGLTALEVATYYNIVQTFQTALGRNV